MIPPLSPVTELITPQPGKCQRCGAVGEVKYYRFPTPYSSGATASDVVWCQGCSFMAVGYITSTWGQVLGIVREATEPKKRTKKR